MSLPEHTPKLSKLPFLVGDIVLLATAWFIANRAPGPLSAPEIAAVFGCVAVGAVLLGLPFVMDYTRRQEQMLDERQQGIEALSRTIGNAAEQISIAASGLHQITEIAHKNLKQAEQLPHRLQEKIAEFNAQLDNAREEDREELEKELAELRSSESERLEAIAQRIHQSVGELAKLEASAQKLIAARNATVEHGEAALAKAQAQAVAKLDHAIVDFDAKLAERAAVVIAAIEAAAGQAAASISAAAGAGAAAGAVPAKTEPAESAVVVAGEAVAAPPKRPRKSRREETPAPEVAAASAPTEPAAASEGSTADVSVAPAAEPAVSVSVNTPEEPPPVPADAMAKIEPVAPRSADPFRTESPEPETPVSAEPAGKVAEASDFEAPAAVAVETSAVEKPARKRAPRKAVAEPTPEESEPELGLALDDTPVTQADAVERVISSDGATRLIATAYIGIGNRLFIRGDGPGLSWEKGVPLQFVSIGKWRWETADAIAPVSFKLFKNDEVECAALGTLTLEPGHQQEVTAKF